MEEDGRVPDEWWGAADELFGTRLALAEQYAKSLVTDGVVRGLIGPREAPRIWERHIFNCAAIAPLMPENAYVIDVGSGAGLPGIVLAIARPDLQVVLVEPLSRRTTYLEEVIADLDLADGACVVRARAEEVAERPSMFHVKHADVVTARAVAPLDRLAGWCLPLAAIGGRVVAMKGSSAAAEIAEYAEAVERLGASRPTVREVGTEMLPEPTIVVEFVRTRTTRGPDSR